MGDYHIVLVYCGWSDWFQTIDVRPVGPFESAEEAEAFKSSLDERKVQRRDGYGQITTNLMRLDAPDAEGFSI